MPGMMKGQQSARGAQSPEGTRAGGWEGVAAGSECPSDAPVGSQEAGLWPFTVGLEGARKGWAEFAWLLTVGNNTASGQKPGQREGVASQLNITHLGINVIQGVRDCPYGSRPICNLISETALRFFCHNLFSRSRSSSDPHSEGVRKLSFTLLKKRCTESCGVMFLKPSHRRAGYI